MTLRLLFRVQALKYPARTGFQQLAGQTFTQFPRPLGAGFCAFSHITADAPAQHPAAVRLRHQPLQQDFSVFQFGVGSYGHLASAVQTGEKAAFRLHTETRGRMFKKGGQLTQVFTIGAHFHTQRPLPHSGQKSGRGQHMLPRSGKPKTLHPGAGEDNRVILPFPHLAQPGFHVPAQQGDPDVGTRGQHLGLTPQSINAFGGFKVQGKSEAAARKLTSDAKALEAAGAFAIVLEAVPAKLAALVTKEVGVPTIGIGAGAGCDGQILVYQDMLGMFSDFCPKFVKRFANVGEAMRDGFASYINEVREGSFPSAEHTFKIDDEVLEKLY